MGDSRGPPRPHSNPPPGLSGDFDLLSRVALALSRLDSVQACKAIPWSHRLTIDFRRDNGVADWFLDEAERSFEQLLARKDHERHGEPAKLLAESSAGSARFPSQAVRPGCFILLWGGALVMTVVGLIVPGIPTVPFLLISSYGFARSSPRINTWLRETKFLGPILTEWEHHAGLSAKSKRKLIGLTGVILVIAVLLAPLSPLGLVLILVIASLSTYGVYRLPSSPEEPGPEYLAQQSRFALMGS